MMYNAFLQTMGGSHLVVLFFIFFGGYMKAIQMVSGFFERLFSGSGEGSGYAGRQMGFVAMTSLPHSAWPEGWDD